MKRVIFLWCALGCIYIGFALWHYPWRGPLSMAEIENLTEGSVGSSGTSWADIEAFVTFLLEDDGRPFVMVNLLEFSDAAQYPEGQFPNITTGDDASLEYAKSLLPLLFQRGSYPILVLSKHNTILDSVGGEAGAFEQIALVRYRSRRDLLTMITSDAFKDAKVHKWASLDNSLAASTSRMAGLNLGALVPVFLVIIGVGASILLGRSKVKLRRVDG